MTPTMLALIVLTLLVITLAIRVTRQVRRQHQMERLLADTNEKLELLQIQFGRFAPQDVIEHLMERDGLYAASRRSVTVLFADLVGFTTMCDRMDPAEVVPILNGYFRCMSRVITRHHGKVNEFAGDGMLVLFGALDHNPWMARDAVLGALAMREELVRYNEDLRSRSLPELKMGIGIHQGEVLAGVIGNAELSKFGVVGDTINTASRVEGLTRNHDTDLLITEEVKSGLDERFRLVAMPAVAVKGKPHPIVTYGVEGLVETGTEPAKAQQP